MGSQDGRPVAGSARSVEHGVARKGETVCEEVTCFMAISLGTGYVISQALGCHDATLAWGKFSTANSPKYSMAAAS